MAARSPRRGIAPLPVPSQLHLPTLILAPSPAFGGGTEPECRRARDTFWDIQVAKMTALGDSLEPGFAPLRDHGYGTQRLRHGPYVEWLESGSEVALLPPRPLS